MPLVFLGGPQRDRVGNLEPQEILEGGLFSSTIHPFFRGIREREKESDRGDHQGTQQGGPVMEMSPQLGGTRSFASTARTETRIIARIVQVHSDMKLCYGW